MDYYKHPNAIVESNEIGSGTRVWAFAHILPGASIGADCNICDHVFIENDVVVGNRVTIKSGVQLWDGVLLEDDVFVGPNATFTNDMFPRSKKYPAKWMKTVIKKGASIGANATILPGVTVGCNAMVGAGSVVTRNVPQDAVVVGNPAVIKKYVDTAGIRILGGPFGQSNPRTLQSKVRGVKVISLSSYEDIRGSLLVAEYSKQLPFIPKRVFFVYDVPSREVRGEHAHKALEQLMVCIHGECSILLDDGKIREELRLDSKDIAIYVPSMVWSVQYKYSSDAVLMVMASDVYDSEDYIREYETFLSLVKK